VATPEWAEALDRRVVSLMPRIWQAVGLFAFILGILACVIVLGITLSAAHEGDYSHVAVNLLLLLAVIPVLAFGRWLMRNRRDPFRRPPS
jgi:hypothetical protein